MLIESDCIVAVTVAFSLIQEQGKVYSHFYEDPGVWVFTPDNIHIMREAVQRRKDADIPQNYK